jgi:hypothetical protein
MATRRSKSSLWYSWSLSSIFRCHDLQLERAWA